MFGYFQKGPKSNNKEQSWKDSGEKVCRETKATNKEVSYQVSWPISAYYDDITKLTTASYNELYSGVPHNALEVDPNKTKILCLSWNTESIGICGYQKESDKWFGRVTSRYSSDRCYKPENFLDEKLPELLGIPQGGAATYEIEQILQGNDPDSYELDTIDLCVVSLQESAKPGDYLLSYTLPEYMREYGYVLLKRSRVMGLGLTTITKQVERGLRMAVFAKKNWYEYHKKKIQLLDGVSYCPTYKDIVLGGKAGQHITVHVPNNKMMFVNMHLPFYASRLGMDHNSQDNKELLRFQNECLKEMYTTFVKEHKPNYIVMMGDMNYRLRGADMTEEDMFDIVEGSSGPMMMQKFRNWYKNNDELKQNLKTKQLRELSDFLEGVGNSGPMFAPTCKMLKGRDTDCTDRECYQMLHQDGNLRTPSWCDRIIYKPFPKIERDSKIIRPGRIVATEYNRIDTDMTCSDHAGVYAVLEIDTSKIGRHVAREAYAKLLNDICHTLSKTKKQVIDGIKTEFIEQQEQQRSNVKKQITEEDAIKFAENAIARRRKQSAEFIGRLIRVLNEFGIDVGPHIRAGDDIDTIIHNCQVFKDALDTLSPTTAEQVGGRFRITSGGGVVFTH